MISLGKYLNGNHKPNFVIFFKIHHIISQYAHM